MAKVEIVRSLLEEIKKKFKGESHKIIDLMESLEENPHKGKPIGNVGGILIKELRYESFRFYFITDGFKIKLLEKEDLSDLLINFIKPFILVKLWLTMFFNIVTTNKLIVRERFINNTFLRKIWKIQNME